MKTDKLWGGRFEGSLDPDAFAFSESLSFDKRLVFYDINVNKAHAAALQKAGYLTESEVADLTNCLDELSHSFKENPEFGLSHDEDIHSAIERLVTEKCGDLGKKMHAGKSRNDQVITDVRLFTKDAITRIKLEIQTLVETLIDLAETHQATIFPGFTHFQPAQPILFSHHLLAYAHGFYRDWERFSQAYDRADVCPLGSGALAGNNYELDRESVARELGFGRISSNSMDAVSDRDFILEFLSAGSMLMTHLSRFCEEIVVFSSPLVGIMECSDAFTTGSSIMPQKKNPDIAELIRGKTGRVLGHFTALQTTIKALPLTYNRDLQEDKLYLFDSADSCELACRCFHKMIASITLNKDAINEALTKGYLTATDLADYLVKKQIPFREAHEITGNIVRFAIEKNSQLEDLSLSDFQQFSDQIDETIYDAISLEASIQAKNVPGGTAPDQVKQQLQQFKEQLSWKKH